MNIVCTRAFGNAKPGDKLEVPDGAVFDHFYFSAADGETERLASEQENKRLSEENGRKADEARAAAEKLASEKKATDEKAGK